MSEDKTPYQEWYERNKDALSERRRARYHSDPEYRAKILAQAKKRRKNRMENVDRGERRPPTRRPIKVALADGREVDAWYSGTLANALGRERVTVHYWIRTKLIPETPYTSNNQVLYTQGQIDAVVEVMKEVSRVLPGQRDLLHEEIKRRWIECGVKID